MADGIIGSVGVGVVPDAEDFWRRFIAATQPQAEDTGRRLGRDVRRGISEELSRPVDIKVNADTARARAELAALSNSGSRDLQQVQKQSSLLRDAIIALGPAVVPVAGVVGGAFIGLVPTVAAVALGVKGVSEEFKNGQLAGTVYGADIHALSQEFSTLKQIASGGILVGLDNAMQGSGPLLKAINQDTAQLSSQFGQIAGDTAPALLSLLTQLNPLFNTFGQILTTGASHLKAWADSGRGVSGFVKYVQGELPTVIHAVASLATTAAHLVQSLAPLGHASLIGVTLLSQALNGIPVEVLTKLETAAVAAYVAFRTYGLIGVIVNAVSASQARAAAANAAFAAQSAASSAAIIAAKDAEAAAVAGAAAEEAAALAATSQAAAAEAAAVLAATGDVDSLFGSQASAAAGLSEQMVLALGTVNSLFASEAEVAATTAAEVAASLQAQAAAAATAAAEQVAAAETSAAASTEAAAAARAASVALSGGGLAAALGPIGAVVAGLGVLSFAFLNTGNSTSQATKDTNDYTAALLQSHGAITQSIRDSAAKKLADSGVLQSAQKLGIQLPTLTDAVLGNSRAMEIVRAATVGFAKAQAQSGQGTAVYRNKLGGMLSDVQKVNTVLGEQSSAFGKATAAEKLQAAAAAKSAQAMHTVNDAAAQSAREFGTTRSAYLNAAAAARKNAQDTRQQTLQMQLANDAAGLLKQSLDRLSGKKISYAQADNAFEQSLVSLQKNLRDGSKAIGGLTEGAISNRGALISLITQAQDTAEAYGNVQHSADAGRNKLVQLRAEIINNAVAQGANRQAVTAYVDSLLKIPKSVPPTKAQIDKQQAEADIATLRQHINAIRQNHVPGLTANTLAANEKIDELQRRIDELRGKTLTITTNNVSVSTGNGTRSNVQARAAGGPAPAGYFTVGEQGWELARNSGGQIEFFSHAQSMSMTGLPSKLPGYAAGGVVTIDPKKASKSSGSGGASSSSGHASVKIDYVVDGKHYASLHSAENAALTQYRANLKLDLKVDSKDFAALNKGFAGTVAAAKAALATIRADAKTLGASPEFLKSLDQQAAHLYSLARDRDRTTAQLQIVTQRVADIAKAGQQEMATIRSAVNSGFDIASGGQNAVTGKVSGNDLVAQDKQSAAKAKKFYEDIITLRKRGLAESDIRQLAEKGTDALPQAEALLSLSKSGLATINKADKQRDYYAQQLGGNVAITEYGASYNRAVAQQQSLTNHLASDNRRIVNGVKHMEDRIANKLDEYARRPILVIADGKTIARVVDEAHNKQAARK